MVVLEMFWRFNSLFFLIYDIINRWSQFVETVTIFNKDC